ncbi:MAG: M3 family oligoendopeptidase [Candidatus Thalassarchaeaceae archaeon]
MESRFAPDDLDASKWENIEPFLDNLKQRKISSANCIEDLISDESQLSEIISETRARTYINMTSQTDNEEYQKAWGDFVENIQPKLSEYNDIINKKIINNDFVDDLPERYEIMLRGIKSDIKIFREENIPLQTRLSILSTKYNEIRGKQTVFFEGEEKTLPMMAIYQESTDRNIRESAWRVTTSRILQDEEEISIIFEEMINLRNKIAVNSGFKGFQEYMFAAMHRFDYSIDDCLEFHNSIEYSCMPLKHQMNDLRKQKLELDKLRPWDSSVDIDGKKPLKPFINADELIDGCSRIFHSMSKELGVFFDLLKENDCLDLESRKGKAPGGYQYYLQKSRMPFIFMNAAGTQRNLETMIHEAGHAFHSFYSGHLDLINERDSPIEFAEVASMSMELLTHPYWEEFYEKENAERARIKHLEGIIQFMPWMATIDSFQNWIYKNPKHTRAERVRKWLEIQERFGSKTEYDGINKEGANLEKIIEISWQLQGHLFGAPFYYVEYGIAQLGALQLWKLHKEDNENALRLYKNGLSLGYTKGLTELFAASGLEMAFSKNHVGKLIQEVSNQLQEFSTN